jgi:hypothetical protein
VDAVWRGKVWMQQVSEEVSGSFGGCCGSDEDACKYHEQSRLRYANLAARIPPRSDAVGSECFTSHLQSWRWKQVTNRTRPKGLAYLGPRTGITFPLSRLSLYLPRRS